MPDARRPGLFATGARCAAALLVVACWALLASGCGAKKKEVTELQRKEADHFVAEAEFAMTMRDWARAEGLLAKATTRVPDNGVLWTSLGSMRVRLGNKAAARAAYESALKAYEEEAAADKTKADVEPWLKQVYVLALLGRTNEGRSLLDKVFKQFPNNRNVRAFVEGKQFDRMLADPIFKEAAL
jgi:tetratricopeptide (TPR) repeat protein